MPNRFDIATGKTPPDTKTAPKKKVHPGPTVNLGDIYFEDGNPIGAVVQGPDSDNRVTVAIGAASYKIQVPEHPNSRKYFVPPDKVWNTDPLPRFTENTLLIRRPSGPEIQVMVGNSSISSSVGPRGDVSFTWDLTVHLTNEQARSLMG
jgi:hypothetical protein